MTAEIIDFGEAKAKILGKSTAQETPAVSTDLSNALEEFSFSRLPQSERIVRSIVRCAENAGIDVETNAELLVKLANELAKHVSEDALTKPIVKV
jgi:hypothetical protein